MNKEIKLEDVKFSSSSTVYSLVVNYGDIKMKWFCTIIKNDAIEFITDVWCSSKHEEEYKSLKKSERRKLNKFVVKTIQDKFNLKSTTP